MRFSTRILGLLAASTCAFAGAPVAADDESLSFAVVGHIRGGADREPHYLLDELVARLVDLAPDLVFLTGDIIWGDLRPQGPDAVRANRTRRITQEWEQVDGALAPLGAAIHRVPGNHDINDPVTRDVFFARYGELPRAVTRGNARFLLLNSSWVPTGHGPPPRQPRHVRGVDLDAEQIAFVRDALAESDDVDHVFLMLHHILWWQDDAAWWRDVHPHLAGTKVRAVFAGDYGPRKFSHLRRDGIDYVQSSIEGRVHLPLLRKREPSRVLHEQFENFVVGRVAGSDVTLEVETLGAFTSGKLTPQHWRDIYQRLARPAPARRPPPGEPEPDPDASVPWVALGGALAVGLLAGVVAARLQRGNGSDPG